MLERKANEADNARFLNARLTIIEGGLRLACNVTKGVARLLPRNHPSRIYLLGRMQEATRKVIPTLTRRRSS